MNFDTYCHIFEFLPVTERLGAMAAVGHAYAPKAEEKIKMAICKYICQGVTSPNSSWYFGKFVCVGECWTLRTFSKKCNLCDYLFTSDTLQITYGEVRHREVRIVVKYMENEHHFYSSYDDYVKNYSKFLCDCNKSPF